MALLPVGGLRSEFADLDPTDVTRLLLEWAKGDGSALDRLMPIVISDLRQIAFGQLRRERSDHTLQPTALVNELYLRLLGRERVTLQNRAHFFGFAAQTMRRILVDHARARAARKRDGDPLELETVAGAGLERIDLLILDRALDELRQLNERQARVIELKFFVGLELTEIAELLEVSLSTVNREWASARAWLFRWLHK